LGTSQGGIISGQDDAISGAVPYFWSDSFSGQEKASKG